MTRLAVGTDKLVARPIIGSDPMSSLNRSVSLNLSCCALTGVRTQTTTMLGRCSNHTLAPLAYLGSSRKVCGRQVGSAVLNKIRMLQYYWRSPTPLLLVPTKCDCRAAPMLAVGSIVVASWAGLPCWDCTYFQDAHQLRFAF